MYDSPYINDNYFMLASMKKCSECGLVQNFLTDNTNGVTGESTLGNYCLNCQDDFL